MSRVLPFFTAFLTVLPVAALSQIIPTPPPATPTAEPYNFELDTVWAHLGVRVVPGPANFGVQAQSNSPLSGWILKDGTGHLLAKGSQSPKPTAQFQVPFPFKAGDRLTLFVQVDNEDFPALFDLDPAAQAGEHSTDLPNGAPAFQPDPDRPYNKMVETLYDRAAADDAHGQADDALSLLKKAQELDPLQPQVQSLLEKVRRQISHPPDEGLTEDSSVGADVEADFQHSPDHTTKKTKWTEGESLSSYFKASETVKTPPRKKSVHKKQTAPHREQLAAEADQTYNLGLESYRAGNYAQAQQYWQQTLDLDPTHFRAKRDLARLKAEHPGLP